MHPCHDGRFNAIRNSTKTNGICPCTRTLSQASFDLENLGIKGILGRGAWKLIIGQVEVYQFDIAKDIARNEHIPVSMYNTI